MTIVLNKSIFSTLTPPTFCQMFKRGHMVCINSRVYEIQKIIAFPCFKLVLKSDEITFEVHIKFNPDDSLSSMNMMFLPDTEISNEMKIIKHLGSGTYGSVFLVAISGKNYALKVGLDINLHSNYESAIKVEMKILDSLRQNPIQHPHLIKSFPIEFPLGPAVLLEIGQETLEDKIRLRSLTFKQKIEIFIAILSTVQFLHKHHIFHCDIKPENIMFFDGVPKLVDFGLAYVKDNLTMISHTQHRKGTIGYIPPKHEDERTQDIYACCIIFIEMLIEKRIESLTPVKIENQLIAKSISKENIEKILAIYSLRETITDHKIIIAIAQTIQ
jgi:serine/threonine protein kinase